MNEINFLPHNYHKKIQRKKKDLKCRKILSISLRQQTFVEKSQPQLDITLKLLVNDIIEVIVIIKKSKTSLMQI